MPRPRNAIGAATEATATITRHTAQAVREPTASRRIATRAKSAAQPVRIPAPSVTACVASGSSTSVKLRRFDHISTAPAAAAMAPSHDNTPTLIHAGEKSSRASQLAEQ